MKRLKYRVVNEHKVSSPYAMIAIEGDDVIVGREDPEMHGWYWCKDENNVEAWAPASHISIKDGEGIFTQDYNSMELDAKEGDVIQYLGESSGWVECLDSNWKYGWIPKDKLVRI
jgi:hypothetical protein